MDNIQKVREACPNASLLIILRTLERVPDDERAISIIKNRPSLSPICWDFGNSRWVSIDALSLR